MTRLLRGIGGFLFLIGTLALAYSGPGEGRFFSPGIARAGNISNASWVLSSSAANATATYTHTFTTATSLPAKTGRVEINVVSPGGEMPNFKNVKLGSNTTAGLASSTLEIFPAGFDGLVLAIQNGSSAIAAGAIKVELTGVVNPSRGGALMTNTITSNQGLELDGKRGGDFNGTVQLGSKVLSGKITDATSSAAIQGVNLEVFGEKGYWRAQTDSAGDYAFFGIPAGSYNFAMSQFVDFNSKQAGTVSQYLAFDPVSLIITDTNQTVNKSLSKSSKTIVGKVKFPNGVPIEGAQANAFSMGPGGFAFGTTGADGSFTLRAGGTENYFVMIMPGFGLSATKFFSPPPRQISFLEPAAVTEQLDLGTIEVKKPDATVTGTITDPNGAPITNAGFGFVNFKSHSFIPGQLNSKGQFTLQAVAGLGTWKIEFFDHQAKYVMPSTKFVVNQGTNDLGTIKLKELTGSVTVKTKRLDTGAGIPNMPVMLFTKEPGPPLVGFTDSSGQATIKVQDDFEGRVATMPGGEGGPGKRGGGGDESGGPLDGGPSSPPPPIAGLINKIIKAVKAQTGPVDASDVNQLFPITAPPKVKAGDTVSIEFKKADQQVTVKTVDQNGNSVSERAFVHARPAGAGGGFFGPGFGGSLQGGAATVHTTSGDVSFSAFYEPSGNYIGSTKTVAISGGSGAVTLTVKKKTLNVEGNVLDQATNSPIKDPSLNLMIGLFSEGGGFAMGKFNPSTGRYKATFAPDTDFRVGAATMDSMMGDVEKGEYVPVISVKKLSGEDGKTITHDIVLKKVDAEINGRITDQNGKGVKNVTVFADPGLAKLVSGIGEEIGGGPGDKGPDLGFSGETNSEGNYVIPVAPGKYNLIVNARDQGLFMTKTVQTEIASGAAKKEDFSLAKADTTINVEVNNQDGGDLASGKVKIFNDEGTIAFELDLDSKGKAKAEVPAGNYSLSAGKDTPETGVVEESLTQNLVMTSGQKLDTTLKTTTEIGKLAMPISQEISGTAALVLEKSGNAEVSLSIPSGALSGGTGGQGSSGNPVLSASPIKAEAIATKTDTPIKGVTISATDSSGNAITTLSSPITGQISYSTDDLPAGINESNLIVKSFNENTGQWEGTTSAVDADKNLVTFSTSHLTDFAITATTDTNPPSAPANIKAEDLKIGGHIRLTWTKPTDSDFSSVTIYRSAQKGVIGGSIRTGLKETTFDDPNAVDGTTYYYTVRAVDTSKNESSNSTQVSAMATTVAGATVAGTTTKATVLPETGGGGLSSDYRLIVFVSLLGLTCFLAQRQTRSKSL